MPTALACLAADSALEQLRFALVPRKLREELSMADDAPTQPQMAHILVPGRDLPMEFVSFWNGVWSMCSKTLMGHGPPKEAEDIEGRQ